MIAVPAVDIRDGACVQLVGGSYADERVRLDDPPAIARRWAELGYSRIHIVDLDAAMAVGANDAVIDEILSSCGARIQVGGGIRSSDRIEALLDAGAERVVIGSRALREAEWLVEQAARFPGAIVVAADVRNGRLAVDGWTRTLDTSIEEMLNALDELPLAGVLVTAVDAEGQMRGPALALLERVVEASRHLVIASGGVTTIGDLEALRDIGVAEAVIGMALYTDTIDAHRVAQEFGR